MLTLLIFIVVIGILVLVHEFGHFITAKRSGMRVDEFGFGFPPRLYGWKKGETTYSINLIPFGGFVKIYGEDGTDRSEPRSFGSKKISTRLKVVIAGVVMNFLFAMLLLMGTNFLGLRVGVSDDQLKDANILNKQIQIIEVTAGSPAEKAGLQPLDQILGFKVQDGPVYVTSLKAVQDYAVRMAGNDIILLLKRGGQDIQITVMSRKNPPVGEGPLGISLAMTGEVHYPWYESIWRGAYDAALLFVNTLIGYLLLIKALFTNGKMLSDVSGPVGIATMTGQAARIGFNYLMQFVAMISMNLAVLNILPLPALDGGRAFMQVIEKLRKKPLSKNIEATINTVGFFLLIGLMIFVTIKDVIHYF